ncbi:LOW QUALITY PROTEIN: hypothetical protein Cgig2_011638 [Carnegiea gigantea]|uniref:Uncharacterized protein n=1 Tax=Carnegiea gigantea TaxID=171969 RepID=A0A9Q1KG31_9CARY|nr:LOW QUALITY PROTEIN: hypothetical protein Cgig2_011638 [Carnegiea gigantea]
MAVWLVRNFDTYSCSLPVANGRMRVTEHDVHVTLGLPTSPFEVVESENEIDATVEFRSLLNRWKQQWPECHGIPECGELINMIQSQIEVRTSEEICNLRGVYMSSWEKKLCYYDRVVFKLRSVPRQLLTLIGWTNDEIKDRGGYLKDTLDKTSMTNEEEEGNEKEYHSKGVEDEGKPEDQTGISVVKAFFGDGQAVINLIITSSRGLAEVITELEELIPGARNPLKRVRKVAAESVSDALVGDTPKRSKSKMSYSSKTRVNRKDS